MHLTKSNIHSWFKKNLSKWVQREHISNNKSFLQQTHGHYNTQHWKAESVPAKIWNKTRMPTLTFSIQYICGSPNHGNQTRKRNKRYPIGREDVKLSLHADDMILYIENLKRLHIKTTKTDKWIQQGSRIQIDIQKSVAFLCTNNEISEREFKEAIPFTMVLPKII